MLNFNLKQLCGPENKGLIVSEGCTQTDTQTDTNVHSVTYRHHCTYMYNVISV